MFTLQLVLGTAFEIGLFAALLLWPAGTLRWWRAWVFIGTMAALGVWASFRVPRDLIEERFKLPVQAGQPLGDRIVITLFVVAYVGATIAIPLDVFRLHLLPRPGPIVSSFGLALVLAGSWIMYLSLRENRFAIPAVRLQAERHQAVVDTGVYGVVRHPMYAGGVLLMLGTPLWLESYAAALLAAAPVGALAVRILIEERLLSRELTGYAAYAHRVRYRLIPLVW